MKQTIEQKIKILNEYYWDLFKARGALADGQDIYEMNELSRRWYEQISKEIELTAYNIQNLEKERMENYDKFD